MTGPRRLSILIAAAALAGCAPEPGVYELSAAGAFARLVGTRLDALRFDRQCGILIHIVPESIPDRSVTWRVYSSGQQMLSFTANLVAVDSGRTRAEITLSREANGREAYDGDQFYPRPAFQQPLRPAIEEQVAALLEGRDYDPARVPRGTDSVCNVQRAGLESGRRFRIDDEPGMDTRHSDAVRRQRERRLADSR